MSPRFSSKLGLFLVVSGMLCLIVYAASEVANLRLGGKPLPKLGGSHCYSKDKVDVDLPPNVINNNSDFRYMFGKAGKDDKGKAETSCAAKISSTSIPKEKEGDEPNEFIKGNQQISLGKFLPKSACDSEGGEKGSRTLCIYDSDGTELELLAHADFSFDTRKVKLGPITDPTAFNGELRFRVDYTPGSGEKLTVETCYGEGSTTNIKDPECPTAKGFHSHFSSSTEVSITKGIKNHTTYALKVRVREAGNAPSPWSDPFPLTPVPATFPLKTYRGAGGQLEFACTQSSPHSWLILGFALIGFWLVRRRHKNFRKPSISFFIIPLFFLIVPDAVHAERGQMNVGFIGAMYRPALDQEKLSSGEKIYPFYKSFFRKKTEQQEGPITPLMGLEFDWHLWDDYGSLQLGFGLGYTFVNGYALELDANNKPDDNKPLSHAKVGLHMYQIRPQLTYIFNPYQEYFPLFPYARAALIAHGYSFLELGKNVSETNVDGHTIKPNGFRFGYQVALGVMLMLDFLQPGAVKRARSGGLFDHVYLKSELSFTQIDSFGTRGFQFSASDVMGTRLPLMWTFGLVFELL
jgi:hypothetical protein